MKLRFEPLEQRQLLATFVVDNTTDVHLNGELNIREAIAVTTTSPENDVIQVASDSQHVLDNQIVTDLSPVPGTPRNTLPWREYERRYRGCFDGHFDFG